MHSNSDQDQQGPSTAATEGRQSDMMPEGSFSPTSLQRRLLVISTAMMASMSLLWGGIYYIFNEPIAAVIPWTYMVVSFISLYSLRAPRFYILLRTSQLCFSLLLPFFLMWALGGFVASSAVVLWSFTCPMGALVFADRRQAVFWFAAFVGLVFLSTLINYPAVQVANNLPVAAVVALFAMNLSGVSLVAFVLMRYFVGQTETAYGLLALEQERSESLVRNMLPEPIAKRLKENQKPIADRLEGVTIVFADIVGFTSYAMVRAPEEVVDLLDNIFSEFDRLAKAHGLEKIKTIGDAYLVCGGLEEDVGGAALEATKFALEALQVLKRVNETGNHDISIRIGIHTGPVVAGVIGETKYSYDIWGDAVNVAARLQQSGEPGQVLLSKATHTLLPADTDCKPIGKLELKGHTPVTTYALVLPQQS